MAVLVRNGFKNYGTTPILQNVNLTVEPGSIYGLLGASGTGKTTLLSCIVSLKKLDAGNITVFGRCPGQNPSRFVGYMPQEVSLGQFFTIAECLAYYGKIYGMTSREISDRTEFLAKFLQLPDTSKLVSTLSGGEGRRVSLSVAVIHSPRLLVLDEPTVGLDPVLRQNIWEYMKHITQLVKGEDKTTILITTHYIDEAKFCDSVGIIRRGRLIAEQNPEMLMDFCNSNSLEDTVLRLCKEDEMKYKDNKMENRSLDASLQPKSQDFTDVKLCRVPSSNPTTGCDKVNDDELAHHDEPIRQTLRHNINIVGALAKKKFLLQARYPIALISNLLLPVFQSVLYNAIVGTPPFGLKMSYVSNDWNMQSEYYSTNQTLPEFCSNIYKSTSISGNPQPCLTNEMSAICSFLNQFDTNDIQWIPTASVAESLNLVRNGDVIGYLEFPSNFTHHFKNRGIYRNFADNETLDGSALKVRMDLSGALSAAWLIDKIFNSYLAYAKETVTNCGLDPAQAELPLKFNPIYGELGGQSIQFMQPALIITYKGHVYSGKFTKYRLGYREKTWDRGSRRCCRDQIWSHNRKLLTL
ncbi:ABC transporter G family member 23 isoform X2 [Folsomia candida]|uniref:ABC transporter G family member 23 isoform X2 n=1 Tax=Folsomia candida TaxID=158441 RepID=UPI001604BA71|nr:ABC transporter G family member 23 isoform X2 [Folsomia candida]